jgi:signal transduction histidine kinase
VDLRDVVTRAARGVEPLLQVRNQHLELGLPSEPVMASVDTERFGRALRNLLGNAQKYGRENGHIGVSVEAHDDDIHVSVTDDGPGIAPEDQERIFERFYRVSTASSAGPAGTGLGLAIARGIVELHGGRLWVESAPGQGSTFHLTVSR